MSTNHLRQASLASAILLLVLCVMSAASGVSQQHFEWVHAPSSYAHDLVRDATWLRAIVVVDDLFVVAYVSATVFLARRLADAQQVLVALHPADAEERSRRGQGVLVHVHDRRHRCVEGIQLRLVGSVQHRS